MKIIYASSSADYGQSGHPEAPERVTESAAYLKDKFEFISPEPAQESDILRVHTRPHLESVRFGAFADLDTPAYDGIFEHAMLSAGAASNCMEMARGGEASFSLMRPPGHHAGREGVAGFCYFNNIAIAVAACLEEVDKVAIIDFDCHHGDGTENIFLGNDRVLFVSLHQSPLYPGTGLASRKNCRNYPLPPLTGEPEYLQALSDALAEVDAFNPDVVAVSAGFDTYKEDPITTIDLDVGSYAKIREAIRALSRPTFSLLEGGYSRKLPQCIESYLNGIS